MPRILESVTVVKTPDLEINEFVGNASSGQSEVSIARVVASGGGAEAWQTPEFDEYVVVIKGNVIFEHSHGPPVEASAGTVVYLAKGERFRTVFPEGGVEYIPVALPGFTPSNVHREEPGMPIPAHDKHTDIYHMVETHKWEVAKNSADKIYYPPTYKQDGFIHATADPKYLLTVGNHFYKDSKAPDGSGKPSEWKLLKMTRTSLAAQKMNVKFESPAPVGDTETTSADQTGGERFPHIYGGIPTGNGVVVEEFAITRDEEGAFTGVVGLKVKA